MFNLCVARLFFLNVESDNPGTQVLLDKQKNL